MKEFNPITWLRNAARNAPWIVMAVAIHGILGAVAAVWVIKHEQAKKDEAATQITVSKPKEEVLQDVVEPPEVIDRKAIPKNEEAEIVSFQEDVFIPTTEPQNEDLHLDRGDPTALDNLPTGGTTGGTAIGVGEGPGHHGSGRPSPFSGRKLGNTGKGRAGGQTQGTDKAVLDGLRWLVRHQNPDGSWGADTLKERCTPEKPCYDTKENFTANYNVGLTSLALLCFLGAGFSHESKQDIVDTSMAKRYKIGDVVKNGLQWLVKRQNQDGSFTDKVFMYNEALATMALTEAFGLTQNRYWKEPAQKGIDFLQDAQRPNPSGTGLWGWRYESRKEIEEVRRAGTQDEAYKAQLFQSDTSVTGWVVMALKSAQLAGLAVKKGKHGRRLGVHQMGDGRLRAGRLPRRQRCRSDGDGSKNDDKFTYHPTTMSALGMCIRIFTQHDPDDPFFELAARRIVQDLPTVSKDKSSIDYYYWYYGSLALNQLDGPDSPRKSGKYWGPWNKAMVEAVLALQDHAERACSNGGWITTDRWSYDGGPLYTTALNTLTLEVYYRYENAFGAVSRKPK